MSLELLPVAIIALIAITAFFNAADAALKTVDPARMHAARKKRMTGSADALRLLAAPERTGNAVFLGQTLATVLAIVLASWFAFRTAGETGPVYAGVVMVLAIAVFATLLPKSAGQAFPETVTLWSSPVLRPAVVLLAPAADLIAAACRIGLAQPSSSALVHDEGRNGGSAAPQERPVSEESRKPPPQTQLDLSELHVADLMIHRTKMETINAGDSPQTILDEILRSPFTRIPLWQDEQENIVGVVHTKDILIALGKTGWDVSKLDIMSFASPPWFVPDTTSLKHQLNAFLKRKAQMALVVDEYGEVQGLITLEDILEEIVGQIADEHDTDDAKIRHQADGTVNVDGTVPVRDLNRHMTWDLPEETATTIAGLVIHEAQSIPEPGQVFTFYGYRFEILRKSRNKIGAIRVKAVGDTLGFDPIAD